jgi:phosphomannomutase
LASVLLRGQPGAKVVHDPRLTWNTIEVVRANGGQTVLSKSGHAFIKQRMREVDGVYGGEMSAHHYFRRFAYCDSGMIPWLLIAQILSETGQPLSKLVGQRIGLFPVSGELNYRVPDSKATLAAVEARYAAQASVLDRTDGVSFEFPDWRFNLRTSNTEPLIRLNVEARGSVALMRAKTEELLSLLKSQGAIAADH